MTENDDTNGSNSDQVELESEPGSTSASEAIEIEEESKKNRERDRTATGVDGDSAEGYTFEQLHRDTLPPDLQYTPQFDDDWVYPSGAKAGGTRDHTPVQGLELGIVGTVDHLQETVEGVLEGLSAFYQDTGSYPRHRIVMDEESYSQTASGDTGIVAVIQPRPDAHDGLLGHMNAMRHNENPDPAVFNPNRKTARKLVDALDTALRGSVFGNIRSSGDERVNIVDESGWEHAYQVADTNIVERYAPLAADTLFDPTDQPVDLDGPGLDSVDQLGFEPDYLRTSNIDPDQSG